jgi:hypothetical protein
VRNRARSSGHPGGRDVHTETLREKRSVMTAATCVGSYQRSSSSEKHPWFQTKRQLAARRHDEGRDVVVAGAAAVEPDARGAGTGVVARPEPAAGTVQRETVPERELARQVDIVSAWHRPGHLVRALGEAPPDILGRVPAFGQVPRPLKASQRSARLCKGQPQKRRQLARAYDSAGGAHVRVARLVVLRPQLP